MRVGRVFIRSAGVLTAAGRSKDFFDALTINKHFFAKRDFSWGKEWVAALDEKGEALISRIRAERSLYKELDRATLMAIAAAREAMSSTDWKGEGHSTGVLVGSSRGATESFERRHKAFLDHPEHRTEVLSSPTTTLGNLSSSIAQDLLLDGPEASFSITCSSALQSLVAALGWIRSDMCARMLVGGTEAALGEFTIAQMKALRIYTASSDVEYPTRPLALTNKKTESFALGEAAVILAIEAAATLGTRRALAEIAGVGWAIEPISTLTSMSNPGDVFFQAMERALEGLNENEHVDAIIAHAPGTILGDGAELAAVNRLFPEKRPRLYSPKWQFGHTFGASGGINLVAALHLLSGRRMYVPEFQIDHGRAEAEIKTVLVNSAGFGGNGCSVLLRRIDN